VTQPEDQAEEKLQQSLDKAYVQGRLPRRQKVKKETQTLFSVKSDE